MTCESSGSARPHLTHQPRERPVLFSGPMVRAIREGRKTQTRRVMKPQPPEDAYDMYVKEAPPTVVDRHGMEQPGDPIFGAWCNEGEWGSGPCPYGRPGDRLWVRETFHPNVGESGYCYKADGCPAHEAGMDGFRWRPSIHMPRAASRIMLEVTGVRVERVQDISVQDCIAEGITQRGEANIGDPFGRRVTWTGVDGHQFPSARAAFASLWESINAERGFGWLKNPWVWVVEFEPLQKEDHVEADHD